MANLDILIRARNEAQAALNELDKSLGGLRKQAGGLSGGLTGLGNVLKVGLVAGAGAAAAALGAVGAAAFGVAQQFDDAQDTLIAMTGASGAALDGMSASVVALHGTVAGLDRSMVDIAAVMGEVNTRTGATGPALDTFSAQILKMTRITGDDGVAAVQKITRVMGDWSVPLADSSGLMDKLFGAGQSFGIGLDSLAGKLVQFGAPLRQMGFGLDESIAMLGKWEKEGVNTELVIGSLRIAAGKFAKEQGEANGAVVGGVKSLVDAQGQLDKLRAKLQLAQMQQAEFTDKTKASSRLSKEQQIAETTRQIAELESAMALGEFRTISSTAANKSLSESLRDTFAAIKNASDGTAALNIGMEVFGARAGPDMTAAIREGRFELDDAIKAMDGMAGSIDDVAERSLGLSERWQMGMTRVKDSLLPVGNELMALGLEAMPFVEMAAGRLADFLGTTLPGVIGGVREAWAEDWGGIRTTVEATVAALGDEYLKMRIKSAIFLQDLNAAFAGSGAQINLTWETFWGGLAGFVGRGFGLIATALTWNLDVLRGAWAIATGLVTGDWQRFWDGLGVIQRSSLNLLNQTVDIWGPEVAAAIRSGYEQGIAWVMDTWAGFGGWMDAQVFAPLRTGLAAAAAVWDGIFLPALRSVWNFIDGHIVPLLSAVSGVWLAAMGVAVRGVSAVWENIWLPALRSVWGFIDGNIIPLLSDLAGIWLLGLKVAIGAVSAVWGDVLLPALREGWAFLKDYIAPIFDTLSTSIQSAIGWLHGLTDALNGVNFGSPFSGWRLPSENLAPGFARGTDFAPGGWAMVGERGPELVNLPRGSQVIPAGETRRMLASESGPGTAGGQSVTINNYVTVNGEQDIVSLTERILSQLRRQQGQQAWLPTF